MSKEIVCSRLQFIIEQSRFIVESTARIEVPDDFMTSMEGVVLFNSTCMCLQTIGEVVRQVDDHTSHQLFARYPAIPWGSIMGMRNFISHEYLSIDHNVIFGTVQRNIPLLTVEVENILRDICNGKHDALF